MPSKRPRLVHVITSLKQGGAETVLSQLVSGLQPTLNQTVIYFYDGPLRASIESAGIKCIQIKAWGGYANPLFFFRLAYALSQQRPQCIHTVLWSANFLGLIAATWLGIPCVSSMHTVVEHEGKLRTWLDRLMPLHPIKTVAVAPIIARSLRAHKKCTPEQLITIPNGIDVEKVQLLSKQPVPIPLPCSQETAVVFGTVGRLVPVKNYPLLIESFAALATQYPNTHLVIIGSGPQEHDLRTQIQNKKLNNRITLITGQSAYPYYRHFTCFVQPSAYEGLSLALLEAMANTLPVIVSAQYEGTHDVITNEVTGIVIPPNDSVALTQALRRIIVSPTTAEQLGAAAQLLIRKHYTSQTMVDAYAQLFTQVYQRDLE